MTATPEPDDIAPSFTLPEQELATQPSDFFSKQKARMKIFRCATDLGYEYKISWRPLTIEGIESEWRWTGENSGFMAADITAEDGQKYKFLCVDTSSASDSESDLHLRVKKG